MKDDGSVVVWGESRTGGFIRSGNNLKFGVTHIFSNYGSFAALKEDGSVVTWGILTVAVTAVPLADLQSGTQISPLTRICALKEDGSVVTWGDLTGRDSSAVSEISIRCHANFFH